MCDMAEEELAEWLLWMGAVQVRARPPKAATLRAATGFESTETTPTPVPVEA